MALPSSLVKKLHPKRLRVSGMFHAILAYMVGPRARGWVTPAIVDIVCTSDGHLLAAHEGDHVGHNYFLGARSELVANVCGLADAIGLTPQERRLLLDCVPRSLTQVRR